MRKLLKTKSHLNSISEPIRAHRIKLSSMSETDANTVTGVSTQSKRTSPGATGNSDPASPEKVRELIVAECRSVEKMLLEKNRAYNNSAINPVRIFSKASSEEQILVRLDDKLSRIAHGSNAGEDVILDTIGYLILLRVLRRVS